MMHALLLFTTERDVALQSALWGLVLVSALLASRAIAAGAWFTMWVAALASLAASVVAIWSIGSLIFLLTCFQLAAAFAFRRSVGGRGWIAALLVGFGAFAVIIYGFAFLRAWDVWLVAIPAAFVVSSLLVFSDIRLRSE